MLALKRLRRGATLVELIVVLSVAGILLALAQPYMVDLLQRYRLNAALRDLHGAIDLTRAQAIARGRRVLLVPLGAEGGDWRTGWVVFIDENKDRRPGPSEELVASHGPLPEGIDVSFNFTSNQQPYYIAFNSDGRSCSDTSSMAARWGTLSLFQDAHVRRIKISMLGRARSCDPTRENSDCDGVERED